MLRKTKLTLAEIALFGMLGAMTYGSKVIMSGLPNIEAVSLFVMLFAVVFGVKGLYPIAVYVTLEILGYGLGVWNLNYLYIWTILWLAAFLLRKMQNPFLWALLSGAFGMLFGTLCAPVDIAIGGFSYAIAKIGSGLWFDVAHCVGNFFIALFLFCPLRKLLYTLYSKMRTHL